ncbi:diphthamide synthesis protein [Candidatus Woesearchaeota archaeon]|nr:diphthamide synthesis protein [Candidatus Woesearchaeota archaeon]
MKLNLDLEKALLEIKESGAKLVCIQLPDGLKPRAADIKQYLEKNTGAEIVIWLGSCFGACDIPLELERLNFDLILQFGHSSFIK